jgi:hypothetical protein
MVKVEVERCAATLCMRLRLLSHLIDMVRRRIGEHLTIDVVKLDKTGPLEAFGRKYGEARVRLPAPYVLEGCAYNKAHAQTVFERERRAYALCVRVRWRTRVAAFERREIVLAIH